MQAIECMTGGSGMSTLDYMLIILPPIALMTYISELKVCTASVHAYMHLYIDI